VSQYEAAHRPFKAYRKQRKTAFRERKGCVKPKHNALLHDSIAALIHKLLGMCFWPFAYVGHLPMRVSCDEAYFAH